MNRKEFIHQYVLRLSTMPPEQAIQHAEAAWSMLSEKGYGDNQKVAEKGPPCPYAEIVKLYNEILPELPRAVDVTEARQRAIKARWNEDPRFRSLEWWEKKFFPRVRTIDLLMGRTDFRGGAWKANLDFLLTPSKFRKIVEGSY